VNRGSSTVDILLILQSQRLSNIFTVSIILLCYGPVGSSQLLSTISLRHISNPILSPTLSVPWKILDWGLLFLSSLIQCMVHAFLSASAYTDLWQSSVATQNVTHYTSAGYFTNWKYVFFVWKWKAHGIKVLHQYVTEHKSVIDDLWLCRWFLLNSAAISIVLWR
jgi:hypothetical protein